MTATKFFPATLLGGYVIFRTMYASLAREGADQISSTWTGDSCEYWSVVMRTADGIDVVFDIDLEQDQVWMQIQDLRD